ncbi:transposase [Streptomyces sp. NPDC056634]|uniref:transposase n=1 Tax=Streptomyces sp. NPDC056634 TaxID=3345885 RepID=UPI00367C4FA4
MVVVESRPIAEVAREIQVNEGTLGTWVSRYRQEHTGEEPPLNISERAGPDGGRTSDQRLRRTLPGPGEHPPRSCLRHGATVMSGP